MWPRTQAGRLRERERIRKREVRIILELLAPYVAHRPLPLRVFEFGAGTLLQARAFHPLGSVVASDLQAPSTTLPPGLLYVLCDVTRLPFRPASFDLIFSNHVLEHVENLTGAFTEVHRVGAPGSLYAFALPTPVWLLFSLPSQYRDKAVNLWRRLRRHAGRISATPASRADTCASDVPSRWLPHGHGLDQGFAACWRNFRARAWRRRFEQSGFAVIAAFPVLCYSAGGWPIVPPNRLLARLGLGSSRLYLLRNAGP